MNKNIFYTYIGGNKAIYIFNLSSFKDISLSLEYYKPLGWKRKVLKKVFYLYLCGFGSICKFFPCKQVKNSGDVQKFLSSKIGKTVDFNVDQTSSIFISSSGDKVIVHHHDNYFEKFAFSKSYKKSCNEIEIYNVLQQSKSFFMVSDVRDIKDKKDYCSFKLYNEFAEKKQSTIDDSVLTKALVEFFQMIPLQSRSVSSICASIREDLYTLTQNTKSQLEIILKKIEENFGDKEVSLGLTHWDFKIWNIQAYENKIQIYDFEESKFDGLPLEDLYNYHIDSKIMAGVDTVTIITFVDSDFFKEQTAEYLKRLKIQTNERLLLLLFLLNRIYFYEVNGGQDIVKRYFDVLKAIEQDVLDK